MDNLTQSAILNFLEQAGDSMTIPASLTLLGGSALALLGSSRPTIDLDYLGDDLHKNAFQQALEELADRLHLSLEAVPLDRFIPMPAGADDRSIFYRRFGQLDVYILDPYTIAMSKIERGFDSDLDDVVFLMRRKLIDMDRLQVMMEEAFAYAAEFDLDPYQARAHLEIVRRRIDE